MASTSTSAPPANAPLSVRGVLARPEHISDATLVYHIILLLLGLATVFILTRLPRAFALFGGASREWAAGHLLWYDAGVTPPPPPTSTRRARRAGAAGRRGTITGSSEKASGTTPRPYPALHFPPHVPSCPAPLRSMLAPLRARLPFLASAGNGAGMGMGQGLILAVYFYAWVYAAFFRSNVFTDPARTGWIAAVQVPIVFALAGKNGIGWLGGWGYEKLNFLHRFVGRMIVVAADIHSLHYFYSWSIDGTFKNQMHNPNNIWGMVALISINLIFLFSLQSVRSRAYNFFLVSHVLGFVLILPAMYLHQPTLLPYMLFAILFLSFDHLLRLFKSRFTTAYLTPLPELEMTRVEIPSLNAGWRAGQHVRLRVLCKGMGGVGGILGAMEVHPFTIANVARKENGEGMVLMCKRAGGWTRRLYEIAKAGGYTPSFTSEVEEGLGAGAAGRAVKVVVEGPYGGPGHVNFASFSAAVYVVGGSGITYALAAIEDLVRKDLKGESRVKVVELVWIVADPACLAPLLPAFTKLMNQSVYTPLRISVFYTRAPIGKQPAYFDAVDASPFAVTTSPTSSSPTNGVPLATVAEVPTTSDSTDSKHLHANCISSGNTPKRSHSTKRPPPLDVDEPQYGYEHNEHWQHQHQHETDSYSRPRPRPPRAEKRAVSQYESPRAAPLPPNSAGTSAPAPTPTSASALMHGQMQSPQFQPQPKGPGPQRQDSNASARTLIGRENSTKSNYKAKRSSTHASASSPGPQTHPQSSQHSQAYTQANLPRGLTLAPGRPKLSKFLEHALQRAVTLSHGNFKDSEAAGGGGRLTGMVVGVCGPGGLADDVVGAVGSLDAVRREQVGGVEVCEEVFGW